jgi:DNA-binding ferritin-like protein (Dps family)
MRIKVKVFENKMGKLEISSVDLDKSKCVSLIYKEGKMCISQAKGPKIIVEDGQEIYIEGQFKPWIFTRLSQGKWIASHETFGQKRISNDKIYMLALTAASARNGIMHNLKKANNEFDQLINLYSDFIRFRTYICNTTDNIYACGGNWDATSKYINDCYTDGQVEKTMTNDRIGVKKVKDSSMVVSVYENIRPYRLIVNVFATNKSIMNNNKHLLEEAFLKTKQLDRVMGEDFDTLITSLSKTAI